LVLFSFSPYLHAIVIPREAFSGLKEDFLSPAVKQPAAILLGAFCPRRFEPEDQS
jgi:hypothetical protein